QREPGVEYVRGDIMDGPELGEAVRGAHGVFHLAGFVSRDPEDGQAMMRVHVDGTRRVIEAAKATGVQRIVVASSSGTIAVSPHQVVHDESFGFAEEVACGWPYYASKIYQEKLAIELADKLGIEVVIVNPSLLLGPGDSRLSSTKDVLRFLRKQVPVVPGGGVNFVDVRDAASATIAAMDRGRAGERYLLGGPNWTTEEFFGRLSRVAKVGKPRLKLPGRWAELGAGVLEHVYRARGKEPPVDRQSVEMANHYWWVDSSKAEAELGFEHRDPTLTLADTVRYLRQDIDPSV
ncbi:MAG: NAD-dependent epimerase/dehydratase family protein, partial [Deltaproteobacteria bacterium]|nr:NAD-dependent epimerase/dehydratase family protein [Deltaproteobacteria bacterium]